MANDSSSTYAVGQAVFIRTDTPDYSEEFIPFRSLDEMVRICSRVHQNLTLEKVIIYGMVDEDASSLTLGFISATKGRRPDFLASPDA